MHLLSRQITGPTSVLNMALSDRPPRMPAASSACTAFSRRPAPGSLVAVHHGVLGVRGRPDDARARARRKGGAGSPFDRAQRARRQAPDAARGVTEHANEFGRTRVGSLAPNRLPPASRRPPATAPRNGVGDYLRSLSDRKLGGGIRRASCGLLPPCSCRRLGASTPSRMG